MLQCHPTSTGLGITTRETRSKELQWDDSVSTATGQEEKERRDRKADAAREGVDDCGGDSDRGSGGMRGAERGHEAAAAATVKVNRIIGAVRLGVLLAGCCHEGSGGCRSGGFQNRILWRRVRQSWIDQLGQPAERLDVRDKMSCPRSGCCEDLSLDSG